VKRYKKIPHVMEQPCLLGLPFSFLPFMGIASVLGLLALAILSSLTNPLTGIITAILIPVGTVAVLKSMINRHGHDMSLSKARKSLATNVRFNLYTILPESGKENREEI